LIQPGANFDGSPTSGLILAKGLREAGFRVVAILGENGPMHAAYRAAGLSTLVVHQRNWLRSNKLRPFCKHLGGQFRAAWDLRRTLRSLRPDLVYLNNLTCLAGAMAAKSLGIPAIWHLRELCADVGGEMNIPHSVRRFLPKTLRFFSQRQIAISKAVANNLFGLRPPSSLTIVPNTAGFAYEGTSPAEPRTQPDGSFVLGVPGTLRPVKGHAFLWPALPAYLEKWPQVTVLVTGTGDDKTVRQHQATIAALGLTSRIRFLGNLHNMPAFYLGCDLICVPSKSEGFGRTIIESFACGLPVIASRVGGIPEIIRDGENGLLVDYGDTATLTHLLTECTANLRLRRKLAVAAQATYSQVYSCTAHNSVLAAEVTQVLAESKKGVGAWGPAGSGSRESLSKD
jgi:glycosyltransferase involved in cell wall biosynthesis